MSFYDIYQKYQDLDINEVWQGVNDYTIERILAKDRISAMDYLALLSPQAEKFLEEMAQKAHKLSVQHFGKVILLYTPMYIANYCTNKCVYCNFGVQNKLPRKKLSLEEVEVEAKAIADTGLRHILILTGESNVQSPVSYIADCSRVLQKYFSSVAIEIYPLEEEGYKELIAAGVDNLTIYQEAYNHIVYDELHISGPKKNYRFRLDAPERACRVGMRSVNVGALLGLDQWQREAFFTGLHAQYLQDKYIETEISVSFPRIRPTIGGFEPKSIVTDQNLVQNILALRLFLPRAGITISTRERAEFRDNLVPLGITKMSAGVSTAVGGHTQQEEETGQFPISDPRSVDEVKEMLKSKGYQHIFKDWQTIEVR